jgi:hypothetical protein
MEAKAHTGDTWVDSSEEHTNNTGLWMNSQPAGRERRGEADTHTKERVNEDETKKMIGNYCKLLLDFSIISLMAIKPLGSNQMWIKLGLKDKVIQRQSRQVGQKQYIILQTL